MPRSKRGRSAPDYDSDHEDHLAASDDDDALMDDDHEEALTDDEEEEVFEECVGAVASREAPVIWGDP